MALISHLRRKPSPEEVVKPHAPQVMRHLRRIFGPHADVDDVFQAVFVEILRSLPRFRGDAQLKTWIHRITLNVAYQEMRFSYREREVRSYEDTSDLLEHTACARDDIARSESLGTLYRALSSLEPKKRLPVILHDIEGHTLKEVGELLGRPLQTVASQVRTGRKELAHWYAEQPKKKVSLREVRS